MSPVPSTFARVLRGLVLRLVLLLDGLLGARAAFLRARLAGLPEGHRRRAGLVAELRRVERARALMADPENHECPRFRGLLAEVARVRNDAGRRGWVRLRWIWGWGVGYFRRRPAGVCVGAGGALAVGRCRCALG